MLLSFPDLDGRDDLLGRAVMRILAIAALLYGALCMLMPCIAANFMVKDSVAMDCEALSERSAVTVGMTS